MSRKSTAQADMYHRGMNALLRNGVSTAGEYAGFSGEQLEIYNISSMSDFYGDNRIGGLTDVPDAWSQGHQLQEGINLNVSVIDATVKQDQLTTKKIDQATADAWSLFAKTWAKFRSTEPSLGDAMLTGSGLVYLKLLSDRFTQMKDNWGPQADQWSIRIKSLTGGLLGPTAPSSSLPGGGGGAKEPYFTTARIIQWSVGGTVLAAIVGYFVYQHYVGKPLSEAHAARRALADHARSADPSNDAAYEIST